MYNLDIAFWPHTNDINIASFRLRCFNVVKALNSNALSVALYDNQIPKAIILSKRYDKKSILKALSLKKQYNTKIILDICDNLFFNEFNHEELENRIENLEYTINNADLIISSTETLANEIKKHLTTSVKIQVIGDTVEEKINNNDFTSCKYWKYLLQYNFLEFKLKDVKYKNRFIWFGNHGSPYASGGMEDLNIIVNDLEFINKSDKISLTILSNNHKKFKKLFSNTSFQVEYLEWNNFFFSRILDMHSISVIPISHNPFTLCKTNNRVAASIKHNLAVCCTCIPSYKEIIDCIDTKSSWRSTLLKYIDKNNKEKQLQITGKIIANNFSDNVIYDKWKVLLRETIA